MIPYSIQEPPDKIKVGDIVQITNPFFVSRIGYPISFDMALEHVEKNFKPAIRAMLQQTGVYAQEEGSKLFEFALSLNWPPRGRYEKPYKKICNALAVMYLENEGYGGEERSIYTKEEPTKQGKQFSVVGKKVVKTGTYYPPWSQQSYEGEWDGGPGGLDNCKTHVILELNDWSVVSLKFSHNIYEDGLWIERNNVRRV